MTATAADPGRPGALAAIGGTALGEATRVATIQVDSGLKYLRGEVYA